MVNVKFRTKSRSEHWGYKLGETVRKTSQTSNGFQFHFCLFAFISIAALITDDDSLDQDWIHHPGIAQARSSFTMQWKPMGRRPGVDGEEWRSRCWTGDLIVGLLIRSWQWWC